MVDYDQYYGHYKSVMRKRAEREGVTVGEMMEKHPYDSKNTPDPEDYDDPHEIREATQGKKPSWAQRIGETLGKHRTSIGEFRQAYNKYAPKTRPYPSRAKKKAFGGGTYDPFKAVGLTGNAGGKQSFVNPLDRMMGYSPKKKKKGRNPIDALMGGL